jgi:hypothetical protein
MVDEVQSERVQDAAARPVPCGMQWHYGTIGPVNHTEPEGKTGWSGLHGALTTNPSGLCDECIVDWRENYPSYDLPRPLTLDEL